MSCLIANFEAPHNIGIHVPPYSVMTRSRQTARRVGSLELRPRKAARGDSAKSPYTAAPPDGSVFARLPLLALLELAGLLLLRHRRHQVSNGSIGR